ncbi:MAG: hypothetical protein IT381_11700 [Deltaproteobacteria bacterium]|nr:hypothetical protein [Deltaproteobacteria bacterium]
MTTVLKPTWPRLAWLAELSLTTDRLQLLHGPFVAVDPSAIPQWASACVWDGPFDDGAFHSTPHVFGTGIRSTADGVHFVPSCTTVDRLIYVREPGRVVVSNSLPVLLGSIGARLSIEHDYAAFSESAGLGVNEYLRELRVEHPSHDHVFQVLYDSLVVDRHGLAFRRRYHPHRFTHVAEYLSAISDIVGRMITNAGAAARRRQTRVVTNASRGYDSSAVSALVASAGKALCYSAAQSNTRIPKLLTRLMDVDVHNDDGTEIARRLGLSTKYLDPNVHSLPGDMERWLWASGQLSPELIFWRMLHDAEASDALTLWFSGHFGDGIWDTHPNPRVLAGYVTRSMPSGYSLAEARIRYGLIDCSLPFLFAEDAAAIHALSLSEEMKPWRLDNDYDRPIPRRILEERGIPRDAFGFGKKAVAQDFDSPQGRDLSAEFYRTNGWTTLGAHAYRAVNLGIYLSQRSLAFAQARGVRSRMFQLQQNASKNHLRRLGPTWDMRRQTFVHCVNTLATQFTRETSS